MTSSIETEADGIGELMLSDPHLPVTSFCIPTKDRPANLEKCLSSYIDNFNRFARTPDIIVSDDSPSFSMRRTNLKAIRAHRLNYAGKIFHLDRGKRRRLIARLSSQVGIRKSILKFGLIGDDLYKATYGANRNTLLLLTAGRFSVQTDDDTVCSLGIAPESSTSDKIILSDSPVEHWFFGSADEAFTAASAFDGSFLNLHETMLGRSVSNPTRDASFPGGAIVCTLFGHAGDCANQSHWRLFASGRSASRLRQNLPWSLSTRFIIGGSHRACVSIPRPLVSMCVGLDMAGYLPPFMPCFRNEDGLFGRLVAKCADGQVFGYLPHLIQHHPPGHRPSTEFVFDSDSPKVSLPVLVEWILEAWRPQKKGLLAGTTEFGLHLKEIGSLRPSAFASFAREVGNQSFRLQLQRTESTLATEIDDQLRHLLKQFSVYQSDILAQTDAFVPRLARVRLRSGRSVPQDFLFRFGELLVVWPEVVEGAKKLDCSDVLA